jgi:hypothetical protein
MGYRSDVAFACDPIIKDVVETVTEWDKEFKEMIGYAEDLSSDDHGRWKFEDIKWYEGYEDVQIIENIMVMCDNVDISGLAYDSYGFIRLGEEMEDVEMKGDTSLFDLYVNRSIDI